MWSEVVIVSSLVVGIISILSTLTLAIGIAFFFWYKKLHEPKNIEFDSSSGSSLSYETKKGMPEKHPSSSSLDLLNNNEKVESCNVCMGVGTLRQVTLSILQDLVINLYNIRVKLDSQKQKFQSEDELDMATTTDKESVQSQLRKRLNDIFKDEPYNIDLYVTFGEDILSATTVRKLIDAMFRICRVTKGIVREWKVENELFVGIVPEERTSHVNFTVEDDINKVRITWSDQKFTVGFMDTISLMLQALRDERRQPTPIEYMATHLAYHYIASGKQLTLKPNRPLGSPGFRPHTQTYMSLTDPGDGHVLGTTRFNDWMRGAIVHVEHLERPGNLSREHIESYRIPSLYDFSRVRLHVGSAAPNTYFVGRRMKDSGNFDQDFLKLVHMTSASASAAFSQGASECKVAMEGLTTSQAVRYMKALRCHVHRNRLSQYLSAAWNWNQTIIDDYEKETPITLKERLDIALRAIEITCIGGFDKVTWDGASDTYPSKCIMYQVEFSEALSLVHEAHSRGMVTYFSAGFKFDEIKHAVYAGVDGIGIGGAQVLRFMDHETGMHGPYMEENIPRILAERDSAAKSVRGSGVALLAKMDTMYFEGSLTKIENSSREQLFSALQTIDEPQIIKIIGENERILDLPTEHSLPLIGSAQRLVATQWPLLRDVITADQKSEWCAFIKRLRSLLSRGDEESIEQEYDGEPWLSYRKLYRESSEGCRIITRQSSLTHFYRTS